MVLCGMVSGDMCSALSLALDDVVPRAHHKHCGVAAFVRGQVYWTDPLTLGRREVEGGRRVASDRVGCMVHSCNSQASMLSSTRRSQNVVDARVVIPRRFKSPPPAGQAPRRMVSASVAVRVYNIAVMTSKVLYAL